MTPPQSVGRGLYVVKVAHYLRIVFAIGKYTDNLSR